jgi:hypothetical protein
MYQFGEGDAEFEVNVDLTEELAHLALEVVLLEGQQQLDVLLAPVWAIRPTLLHPSRSSSSGSMYCKEMGILMQ